MTTKNAKAIEAHIKGIEKESATFIGKLESELEFAKTQRMTEKHQKDLERQIEQARAVYDGQLEPRREQLKQALAEEEKEFQEFERAAAQNAATTKEAIKRQMMTNWIQSGGSLETFDNIFETTLYPAEMARRVQEQGVTQQAQNEEGRRQIRKVSVDSF